MVGAAAPELADTGVHNLVPLVFRALRDGRMPRVFGGDYPTPDGSCVRDYVDVRDVADAHVRAAELLEVGLRAATYNVGRGAGSSVLEVLDVIRTVTGRPIEHEVVDRRPGDPARIVGSVERIAHELGWRARRDLTDMVESAWAAEVASPSAGDRADLGLTGGHARALRDDDVLRVLGAGDSGLEDAEPSEERAGGQ